MVVFNVKFSKLKRAALILIAAAAAVTAACLIIYTISARSNRVSDTATCDELGEYSLYAETAAEQRAFLARFGLTAEEEAASCEAVIIPSEFNEVYAEYNELQRKIGLDLERYSGKRSRKNNLYAQKFKGEIRRFACV
ncbi:MAG: DUF4830 domain-containing protein [Clostridiales bacterium]|nr:DUF4830 domain-containing protein [Clostridiales bacterium]